MIVDSGHRREFTTGAMRDRDEGKGIPTLISPHFISCVIEDKIERCVHLSYSLLETKNIILAEWIACTICDMFSSHNDMIVRLSKHLEAGAKKYSPRNWEKGMPIEEYINSLIRHLTSIGREDEDHLAAATFNIMALIHTWKLIEMCQLPSELSL